MRITVCGVKAALSFHGDDLRPEEVSAAVGLVPSDCWRKGDPAPEGPRYSPKRTGLWSLDSDRTEDSVEAHAEHLLSKIRHLDAAAFERLLVHSRKLYIRITLEPNSEPQPSCRWEIREHLVEELARLGFKISCVVLFFTPDPPDFDALPVMTVRVSVALLGQGLDPDEVSTTTQITPSRNWRSGELPSGTSGSFAQTDGGWILDACDNSTQIRRYIPSEHIQALLDRFRSVPRLPLDFLKTTSAKLHFETIAEALPGSSSSLEWEIEPQQIRELARLGLGISGFLAGVPPA
jgi:hypothetical protein